MQVVVLSSNEEACEMPAIACASIGLSPWTWPIVHSKISKEQAIDGRVVVVSRLRCRLGTAAETRSRARACDATPRVVPPQTSKAAAIGREGEGWITMASAFEFAMGTSVSRSVQKIEDVVRYACPNRPLCWSCSVSRRGRLSSHQQIRSTTGCTEGWQQGNSKVSERYVVRTSYHTNSLLH